MGILNVTPDSFSDGNRFADVTSAVEHGIAMLDEGADLLDIGGESTRPGAQRVDPTEQIRRVVPVIAQLRERREDICISVDTTRAEVAAAAMDAGATLINDISAGLDDPEMFAMAKRLQAPIVLMHMQGAPATMQKNPRYGDVVGEIRQSLVERRNAALGAGIAAHRVLVDPGIGFGKTMSHNFTLIREVAQFASLGAPLLIGVSRKKFIGTVIDEPDPTCRAFGTAAAAVWCAIRGVDMLRVHEVKPIRQALQVLNAIEDVSND